MSLYEAIRTALVLQLILYGMLGVQAFGDAVHRRATRPPQEWGKPLARGVYKLAIWTVIFLLSVLIGFTFWLVS